MPIDLDDLATLHYEVREPGETGVAVVTLDRPETRNAQNKRMTYEINAGFDDAARRTDVKVIVLQADGPHFSSGHDMRDREKLRRVRPGVDAHGGLLAARARRGTWRFEEEIYFQMCWRWRNIPKPLIAAAQGKTIAGGLMLLWVADVIIAADDAQFSDPVVGMGVNGVEYFGHPWELGRPQGQGAAVHRRLGHRRGGPPARHGQPRGAPRRAARRSPWRMAARIATRPSFALKLAKESVNQTLEAQGQYTALRAAFTIQHLAHAHNRIRYGIPVDPGSQPGT